MAPFRGKDSIQHCKACMEVNLNDWPKYLPMTKVEARRPIHGGTHEGTFIEMNGSTAFNDLPKFAGTVEHICLCNELYWIRNI